MKLYELFEKIRSTNQLAEFTTGLPEVCVRCYCRYKDEDNTYQLRDPNYTIEKTTFDNWIDFRHALEEGLSPFTIDELISSDLVFTEGRFEVKVGFVTFYIQIEIR